MRYRLWLSDHCGILQALCCRYILSVGPRYQCNFLDLHTIKILNIIPYGIKCPEYTVNDHFDDVIKWKPFSGNWPFVRGIHRSPVNSPQKGQWRGPSMFSWTFDVFLICAWINAWVNSREAGELRHHQAHYDVTVMRLRTITDKGHDSAGVGTGLPPLVIYFCTKLLKF